jgi:hypothetical protein
LEQVGIACLGLLVKLKQASSARRRRSIISLARLSFYASRAFSARKIKGKEILKFVFGG